VGILRRGLPGEFGRCNTVAKRSDFSVDLVQHQRHSVVSNAGTVADAVSLFLGSGGRGLLASRYTADLLGYNVAHPLLRHSSRLFLVHVCTHLVLLHATHTFLECVVETSDLNALDLFIVCSCNGSGLIALAFNVGVDHRSKVSDVVWHNRAVCTDRFEKGLRKGHFPNSFFCFVFGLQKKKRK
jgi:hypothetical protein